ncbi:MAG: BMP family ABC transporter substrate-binding protein [Clostridiaceae bacterium]|nr:BMP family ABC transporter substrate-binding protein [Clostridiaceae bacterium]
MKKKILTISLALILLLSLVVGCGKKDDKDTAKDTEDKKEEVVEKKDDADKEEASEEAVEEDSAEEATDAESAEEAEPAEASDALKIVIVSSPSGVDDGSFNQDNYLGILNFIKNHPDSTVEDIRETEVENSVATASSVVGDYDVIVTPGFQFAGISMAAVDNPDKFFILVDSFPTNVDDLNAGVEFPGEAEYPNIYAMQFKEQEAGFLAGVAAALETKSGKVAVVNGIAYPSNVNYQYGFEAGVAYAVKHFEATAEVVEIPSRAGTDVTGADVGGNYIGDFADEVGGKQIGEDLLKEGVDIMLVAAGGSGNGVFTAVKEHGDAMVIGCDVDQFDDGVIGDKNIILTSVLKVMNLNVERQLEAIANGTFAGKNEVLGADSDSVDYVKAEGRHQLSDDTLEKLEDVLAKIKDGTIVPPGNFTEDTVENFKGLD